MSASNSEGSLSYENVAKVADVLANTGKKIRIDEVRTELGYGDPVQIASFLRKWQASNSKTNNDKSNNRLQSKPVNKNQNNQPKSHQKEGATKFYQYDDASSYTIESNNSPFCYERFLEESETVKSLFLAICCVRQNKNDVLERIRKQKSSVLSFYKQSDRDVRRIKIEARNSVKELNAEFTKIYVSKEQEINSLKDKTT